MLQTCTRQHQNDPQIYAMLRRCMALIISCNAGKHNLAQAAGAYSQIPLFASISPCHHGVGIASVN